MLKNSKKSSNDPTMKERIQKVLQDKTRLQIIIYLLTYNKLTLKELSEKFNKGKTTIHHHLHQLEVEGFVSYEEDEQDNRKIKTRYYYVSKKQFSFIIPNFTVDPAIPLTNEALMTENALNQSLIDFLTEYLEESTQSEDFGDNIPPRGFQTIILNERTQNIYYDFLMKLHFALQEDNKSKPNSEATYIVTHAMLPIQSILDWKKKKLNE